MLFAAYLSLPIWDGSRKTSAGHITLSLFANVFPIPSLQNLNTASHVLRSTPNTSISASYTVYARYLTCSAASRQNKSALLVISEHLTLLVNLNPMSIQETQSPGSFLARSDFLPLQNNITVDELFTIN
jgi:hypothetical protein